MSKQSKVYACTVTYKLHVIRCYAFITYYDLPTVSKYAAKRFNASCDVREVITPFSIASAITSADEVIRLYPAYKNKPFARDIKMTGTDITD